MKQVLAALKADCRDLHSELDLGTELLTALDTAYSGDRQKLGVLASRSRRQSYVNGIISIYGLLEENVDKLVIEVASLYGSIYAKYADLPERTRDAYRELSLRCLLEKDRVRLRQPINESAAIHSLVSNSSDVPPQLEPSVFTYATSNYRFSYVLDLLLRVGVDARRRIEAGRTLKALTDSGLNFRSVDSLISDLVTRRNEVAHSYQTVDMLDVSTLKAYLEVIRVYLEELQLAASETILRVLADKRLELIGKVSHVWKQAIGVEMSAGSIEAPCSVLLVRESAVAVLSVSSLQSGDTPLVGRVRYASEVLEVGMGFSGEKPNGTEGAEVFVLPDRWTYLSLF
ncbi:HEPN domain-containing protein [Streptomyces sp. NPDC088141]|uniref:HEPN domain-containing protein n=1 Tax=unclassified Streptomyces TaxID=2593676 RepID=UPI003418B495